MLEGNQFSEQGSITQSGTVKWFCDHRGYGFLKVDDIQGDIFAHYSEIVAADGFKKLRKGQSVLFEVFFDSSQKKAKNIRVVS